MDIKKSKRAGFLIIVATYLVALAAGFYVFVNVDTYGLIGRLFLADVAATMVVFLFSLLFKNASIYDPYWSVAPIVILGLLCVGEGSVSVYAMPFLVAIGFWGIRLTANWAYTFSGLHRQDWRYDMLKDKSGRWFWAVNLFGIHLFPTLIVFLALLPAVEYVLSPAIRPLTIPALALCYMAAILQMVSDFQMHRFRRRSDKNDLIEEGLWKYARHPNYFGEILMWWGVFFVMLSVYPNRWYLGLGALLNTLMFLFISIPMAEKRLAAAKDGFDGYRERTRLLLPIRKR